MAPFLLLYVGTRGGDGISLSSLGPWWARPGFAGSGQDPVRAPLRNDREGLRSVISRAPCLSRWRSSAKPFRGPCSPGSLSCRRRTPAGFRGLLV